MSRVKTAKGVPCIKPIDELPEVQTMVDLGQEIASLKAEHPEVFSTLATLVDRYNAALEVAEAKVRAAGVSCGPFSRGATSMRLDAEAMYEELGEEQFLALGGTVSNIAAYSVDRARVLAAVSAGKIPKDCADAFVKESVSYHSPKKLHI